MMEKIYKIVFFIERLGDRIALKYVSEQCKLENPKLELIAYQEYNYQSVKGFNIVEWAPNLYNCTLYAGQSIDERILDRKNVCNIMEMERLTFDPANLFVYLPKFIHDTGRYPTLTVPDRLKYWLDGPFYDLVGHKTRPIICFHPLLDAPYAKSRNHNFDEWEKCIQLLSKEDVIIYRIGTHDSMNKSVSNGKNIFDFAELNYSIDKTLAIIYTCDIFIGGDTGTTHAASAFGKNIVGVWGDITHMQRDKSKSNNIQYGDWDTTPYVPEENRYMLRRDGGEHNTNPVFKAEQILEGIDHFLRRI